MYLKNFRLPTPRPPTRRWWPSTSGRGRWSRAWPSFSCWWQENTTGTQFNRRKNSYPFGFALYLENNSIPLVFKMRVHFLLFNCPPGSWGHRGRDEVYQVQVDDEDAVACNNFKVTLHERNKRATPHNYTSLVNATIELKAKRTILKWAMVAKQM